MTWLERQVRKAQLLQIAACLAVVLAVAGLAACFQRYYANYFAGPYDIPTGELTAATNADDLPRYWVRLTPQQVIDSGVDHITISKRRGRETGRSVTAHYWLAVVGDRLMVVSSPNNPLTAGAPLQGVLRQLDSGRRQHFSELLKPEHRARLLPFLLDVADFDVDTGQIGLVGAGFAVAGALGWAAFAGRRAISPRGHHALAALTRGSHDIDAVSRAVEADVAAGQVVNLGKRRLTRDYIFKTGLGFDIRPNSDLVWAYTITTNRKIYGIIPMGSSHQIALHYAREKLTEKIKAASAEVAMPAIARVSPWTFVGWATEIDEAWRKSRPELVDAVAQRRAVVLAHWSGAAGGGAQAGVALASGAAQQPGAGEGARS